MAKHIRESDGVLSPLLPLHRVNYMSKRTVLLCVCYLEEGSFCGSRHVERVTALVKLVSSGKKHTHARAAL